MFCGVGFAADKVDPNLDIAEVKETRQTVQNGNWVASLVNDITFESEKYEKGDIIYVLGTKEDNIYGHGGTHTNVYLECYTQYGIRYIPIEVTEDYDYLPKPQPKKVTSNNGVAASESSSSSGSGSHSKKVRITAYCKACNGGGGTHTASGVKAYVGGCAMKGVPFGTVVHTSYGDFTVMDRPGGSNILDIYIGDYDSCHCSGAGYHGTEVVTWD